MPDVLDEVKSVGEKLNNRLDDMTKLFKEQEERLKHAEDNIKRLGGEKVDGDATLAEQVAALKTEHAEKAKLVNSMRETVEQYTKQLPALAGRHGSEKDSNYAGFWPNAERAAQFGLFVMAGHHPNRDLRRSCAEQVAKAGLTLRTSKGQFAKADDYVKAMGEGTDSAGGYLVPDEFMTTIIRHVDEYGVARQALMRVPMSRDRQLWPKRTAGFTVYYPDEGVAPTASDLTLGQVTLTAKKWAVLTYFSKELEEDEAVGLGELIALEIALALAQAEDTNAFLGDGTATYASITGVFESSNVAVKTMDSGDTSFADVGWDYLVDTMTSCPDWVLKMPDTAWYMSPGVRGICMKVKGTDGQPLLVDPNRDGFGFLIGYPIRASSVLPGVADDAVSTKFIGFGSMRSWGMMGVRRAMTLERSAEVKWLQDQIAIKAVPRQDIVEAEGTAMAVLKTAAS